jgi:hypothetical protein
MTDDKQHTAFFSYSRVNKEFATKLAKGLMSAGYPIWFDLFDIPTGSRWDDEVEKALHECSIFMIILTPASIASENVKDEIGFAIDHGKRILPILLEPCEVPLRLRRFQYVDFTAKSFEEGFESAKELLGTLLDEVSVPVPAKISTVENQMTQKAKYERYTPAKPAIGRKDMRESEMGRKKQVSQGLVIGIVGAIAVFVLVIAGIGFNALYKMVNSNTSVVNPATETSVATQPPPAAAAPGPGTLEATIAIPATDLLGDWKNEDPNTNWIPRIKIQYNENTYLVETWGACSPTDCYWNEYSGSTYSVSNVTETSMTITWNVIIGQPEIVLRLVLLGDGRLEVTQVSGLGQGSGYFLKTGK